MGTQHAAPLTSSNTNTSPSDPEEKAFYNHVSQGQRYEDAFATHTGLLSAISRFLSLLERHTTDATNSSSRSGNDNDDRGIRVLDCGCGTGRPVAQNLLRAGYDVFGIDFSPSMIELARRNAVSWSSLSSTTSTAIAEHPSERKSGTAHFEEQDMLTFSPSSFPSLSRLQSPGLASKNPDASAVFNAIVAMFSLFTLQPDQIISMLHKFSQWLYSGGYLLIGTIAAEDFPRTLPHMYESSNKTASKKEESNGVQGRWATGIPEKFMGKMWSINLFTRKGWREVLEGEGFELVEENGEDAMVREDFSPPPDLNCEDIEPHLFIFAKKKG